MKYTTALITLITTSPSWANKPAADHMNTEKAITKVISHVIKGNGWSMTLMPDGTLVGKEGGYEEQGTWHIKNSDTFCRTWRSWGQGQESCFGVTLSSKGKMKFSRISGPTASFSAKVKLPK